MRSGLGEFWLYAGNNREGGEQVYNRTLMLPVAFFVGRLFKMMLSGDGFSCCWFVINTCHYFHTSCWQEVSRCVSVNGLHEEWNSANTWLNVDGLTT
jgi:hypothetical protein